MLASADVVPPGHGVQAVCAVFPYVPAAHLVHVTTGLEVVEDPEMDPSAQGVQEAGAAEAVKWEPAAQVQEAQPEVEQSIVLPDGQARQR